MFPPDHCGRRRSAAVSRVSGASCRCCARCAENLAPVVSRDDSTINGTSAAGRGGRCFIVLYGSPKREEVSLRFSRSAMRAVEVNFNQQPSCLYVDFVDVPSISGFAGDSCRPVVYHEHRRQSYCSGSLVPPQGRWRTRQTLSIMVSPVRARVLCSTAWDRMMNNAGFANTPLWTSKGDGDSSTERGALRY